MQNIYDKVHALADELKNDPQVIDYREATNKISENPEAKKMVEDFRRIQFEAYSEQVQTGKISKETEEKMQNLGGAIMLNPQVSSYISAEAAFAQMWDDILKILNDAIGVNIIAPSQE
ncbi:YlbF family regulator [Clostridium paridis]|uniref:YlbF family regulator n=1 Tax=Clostridium paridis TaxID=2803863 RepID=A0A937K330_9CLOT|nr:YlbF family regulator [Clostridium paridis]MBL4931991.1 YlbF family regulator [Clostridium paridis]